MIGASLVFIQRDLKYIYNRHCLSGASSSRWWRQCSYFGHFSPFLKYFSLYSLFCAALKNIESNNLIYIHLMYQYNTINNNYNILIWSCGVVLCANACYSEHCFSLVICFLWSEIFPVQVCVNRTLCRAEEWGEDVRDDKWQEACVHTFEKEKETKRWRNCRFSYFYHFPHQNQADDFRRLNTGK